MSSASGASKWRTTAGSAYPGRCRPCCCSTWRLSHRIERMFAYRADRRYRGGMPPADRPQPTVVLVNGPPGVGKTTVGRLLAETARNGVCIHGDDLKRFVVAREEGTVEGGLASVGAAALAGIYLRSEERRVGKEC